MNTGQDGESAEAHALDGEAKDVYQGQREEKRGLCDDILAGQSHQRLQLDACKGLCAMGLPMGLQYSITAIGSIVMQTAVNALGSVYVSAGVGVFKEVGWGVHGGEDVPAENAGGHGEHQGDDGGQVGRVGHKPAHRPFTEPNHPALEGGNHL